MWSGPAAWINNGETKSGPKLRGTFLTNVAEHQLDTEKILNYNYLSNLSIVKAEPGIIRYSLQAFAHVFLSKQND